MNPRLKKVLDAIKLASKEEKVPAGELTQSQVFEHNAELTAQDFRVLGGFKSVLNTYYPMEDKDLPAIKNNKNKQSYVKQLENRVGEKELFEQELLKVVKEKLVSPVVKQKKQLKSKNKKSSREIVAMLNDLHYGLTVDKEEVGGTNQYGWLEASRRTAYFLKEVCDFKREKRDEVEILHIILNGDLLSGIIHNTTGAELDLMVYQVNGATHILTHFIDIASKNFKNVKITAIPGNHEDQPNRREGGRVMSQAYDNFSNILFFALSTIFKDYDNVTFEIPKTPYAFVDLPAGRMMIAHGHGIFSKALGNPGRNINTKALSEAIHQFSAGEVVKGNKPIKLLLFGHTHAHFYFTTPEGIQMYNAPSLSGVDGYANTLGINHNLIGQLVFESVKGFIFGDNRLIRLNDADGDSSLDKIIPPYEKKLKWNK